MGQIGRTHTRQVGPLLSHLCITGLLAMVWVTTIPAQQVQTGAQLATGKEVTRPSLPTSVSSALAKWIRPSPNGRSTPA